MSFPIWIPVGPWRLHPHLVFESRAYVFGFRVFLSLRNRRGDAIPEATRFAVVAGAAVGAALGSKLVYWLQQPSLTPLETTRLKPLREAIEAGGGAFDASRSS